MRSKYAQPEVKNPNPVKNLNWFIIFRCKPIISILPEQKGNTQFPFVFFHHCIDKTII